MAQQALAVKECASQPPVIPGIFGLAFFVFSRAFVCLQNGFTRVGILDQSVKKRVDLVATHHLIGCIGRRGTGRAACPQYSAEHNDRRLSGLFS